MKDNFFTKFLLFLCLLWSSELAATRTPSATVFCDFSKNWLIENAIIKKVVTTDIGENKAFYKAVRINDDFCSKYAELLKIEYGETYIELFFDYQAYKKMFSLNSEDMQEAFKVGALALFIPFFVEVTIKHPTENQKTLYTLIFDHFYGATLISQCNEKGDPIQARRRQEQNAGQIVLTNINSHRLHPE